MIIWKYKVIMKKWNSKSKNLSANVQTKSINCKDEIEYGNGNKTRQGNYQIRNSKWKMGTLN